MNINLVRLFGRIKSLLYDGGGTALTSTLVGADQALDVNVVQTVGGSGGSIVAATRYAGNVAAGSVGGAYGTLLTPGVQIRMLRIINYTDGDVIVSLDSGSTDHWALAPGEKFVEDYGSNFLKITDDIEIKQGTKAPANGTVYCLAYSS